MDRLFILPRCNSTRRAICVASLICASLPVAAQLLPEEEVLLSAAKQGNLTLFRSMMQAGASAHVRDAGGANALVWAVDSGSEEMLREALLLRIDPNAMGVRGLGALSLLTLHNRVAGLDKLLDAGAQPDVRNADGSAALHVAAQLGREAMVQRLLGAGARVNLADGQGQTPLHRAAKAGHAGVVRLLLEHGANPHAMDGEDRTPLVTALLAKQENAALAVLQQAPASRAHRYKNVGVGDWAQQLGMRSVQALLSNSP